MVTVGNTAPTVALTVPVEDWTFAFGDTIPFSVNASYTDHGDGAVPALSTAAQTTIRQKRQEVEHVVSQSGTNTATSTDQGGGLQ